MYEIFCSPDVGESRGLRRSAVLSLAAETVVDDTNGHGATIVWLAVDLCFGLGSRSVHLHSLLDVV